MSYTLVPEIADPEGFRLRLLKLREERGLSQRDMAFPGCTHTFICRIERGERTPSLEIIQGLAEILGVSPYYLLTGDEESLKAVALQIATELEGGVIPPAELIAKLKKLANELPF
jgi:transcriptional regulator with XRE-family HTH domain